MPPAASIASRILPSARLWSLVSWALIVSSTCASPVPRPGSHSFGSLGPTSPSSVARGAMPSRNAPENVPITASETPSARRPGGGDGDVERRQRLLALRPRLGGRDVVEQAGEPGPALLGRAVDVHEGVARAVVVVAVGAQDVALDVGEVHVRARARHRFAFFSERLDERRLQRRRVQALRGDGELDHPLALGERPLDRADRRVAVGRVEDAALDLVVQQVLLQRRALGALGAADAAPPDLLGERRELLAQVVEVGVDVAVEVAREDEVRAVEVLLLALPPRLVVVEVRHDHEARDVRAGELREGARAGRLQAAQVGLQRLALAVLDRRHRHERVGLAGAVGVGHQRQCWTSVSSWR